MVLRPCLDHIGPLCNKRDAMTALKNVRLVSPVYAIGSMAPCDQFFDFCRRRAAVVRGKQDQGVVFNACLVHSLHELTDVVIHHHDKIAVRIQPTLALPRFGRENGCVRRGERQVQEKGLAATGVSLNVFYASAEEIGRHIFMHEIRRCEAPSPPAVFPLVHSLYGWDCCDAPVLYIHIGCHVQ